MIKKMIAYGFTFIAIAGLLAFRESHSVDTDFNNLKAFLTATRYQSVMDNKTRVVKFEGKRVTVSLLKNKRILRNMRVPTLDHVSYDTTLGTNMIVFTGSGTSEYNVRIHGGELELKSWLGRKRFMAINCTGFASEGRYPSEN
jgi:hypothetical protein